MLPLVDKPAIQYVVEEAVAAGLKQIVMVTAGNKSSIENHFDHEFELEAVLEARGHSEMLELVRQPTELANMAFVEQKERLGIGHAILTGQSLIGEEAFALFFPDDIIFANQPAISQLIDIYERYDASILAVEQLPKEDLVHYGSIKADVIEDGIYEVKDIVEKPLPEEAPSNLAITGRYILKPDIFAALEKTPFGKNGELQLTDGLIRMLEKGERIFAYQYQGERFDTGQPLGLLKASLTEGLRRSDIGPKLRDYLKTRLD